MNKNNINFPRLLVLSLNAWSDRNSVGNTISNHFGGWDADKLSNLYLRNDEIDNECCSTYFRISEKEILKSIFTKDSLGVEIQYHKDCVNSKQVKSRLKTSDFFEFIKRIRPTTILLLREIFWFLGFRGTNKLDDFLKKVQPEVIHIHCPNLIYGHRVLHYCHKVTKAKIVVFFGDEIYTYKNFWPLNSLYQFFLRSWIRKTIKISNLNYAATPELCEYYGNIFNSEFKLLYKGATIELPFSKPHNQPIKIVYAGNLLYDRWRILSLISNAIEKVSTTENLFYMSIYTASVLSNKMDKVLNTTNSRVIGSVPFSEVKKILSEADIVLHVETSKKKFVDLTKYSFSTKIVDCIQCGSCIMAVGPRELASISFLRNSEAAMIANSFEDICSLLSQISKDNTIIDKLASKMYYYAKSTFDIEHIRTSIYSEIIELVHSGKN